MTQGKLTFFASEIYKGVRRKFEASADLQPIHQRGLGFLIHTLAPVLLAAFAAAYFGKWLEEIRS